MLQSLLTQADLDEGHVTEDISETNSEAVRKLLVYGSLCCNGSVLYEEGKETHLGDPTETSIIAAARKNGILNEKLKEQYPRLAELPFDSDRKLMTTIQKKAGHSKRRTGSRYGNGASGYVRLGI